MQKLFTIPKQIRKENFSEVMEQAITLELATIPTYLSTYYSIDRSPGQDAMYKKIVSQMKAPSEGLARELTLDVLVYANKTAALIMGVLIEEMLHLALSSNVKQAICKQPPNLMEIGKVLKFPKKTNEPVLLGVTTEKGEIKELHTCMGLNSCKDKGYSANNACAGQGDCATVNHSCHTLNECAGQGGCGLFGTAAEFCHPGENDCQYQGSCGSPIIASRFIAAGPNRGLSVWQLARKRFEEKMKRTKQKFGPVPAWLHGSFAGLYG